MESTALTLLERISSGNFAFTLRGWKEPAHLFFAPGPARAEILAERRKWLQESPERHLVCVTEAWDLAQEVAGLAQTWDGSYQPDPRLDLPRLLQSLGEHWEADIILCRQDDEGRFCMQAGVVCFPSYWAPEEKIGLPVEMVHAPVPGLNTVLGKKIETLLDRLPAGKAWLRTNWGLSASAERNQHPLRPQPRLNQTTPIEDIWLRLEHQALVRLPESHGILFGIQLHSLPLESLRQFPAAAQAIAGQLHSMPEAMLVYKGIKETASRVSGWLEHEI